VTPEQATRLDVTQFHDEASSQPDLADLAMGVEYRDRARRTAAGRLTSYRHTVVRWSRRGTLAP